MSTKTIKNPHGEEILQYEFLEGLEMNQTNYPNNSVLKL